MSMFGLIRDFPNCNLSVKVYIISHTHRGVAGDVTQNAWPHDPKVNRDLLTPIAAQNKVEGLLAKTVVTNQVIGRSGNLLLHDYNLVEVRGGEDCFYASMLGQIFCDGGEQQNYLRAATAQYLLHNKSPSCRNSWCWMMRDPCQWRTTPQEVR